MTLHVESASSFVLSTCSSPPSSPHLAHTYHLITVPVFALTPSAFHSRLKILSVS